MKLTKPQEACLLAAARETHADNSGAGYGMYDGVQLRIAERLKKMGLVTITMPTGRAPLGRVLITDEGRVVLKDIR